VERWQKGDEGEILSCTLITTNPNDVVGQVHNRMPVILPATAYDQWLQTAAKDAGGTGQLAAALPSRRDDGNRGRQAARACWCLLLRPAAIHHGLDALKAIFDHDGLLCLPSRPTR
jgi:hypothetical protein